MSLDLSKDYLLIDDPISVFIMKKKDRNSWAHSLQVYYVFREEVSVDETLGTKVGFKKEIMKEKRTIFHIWRTPLDQADFPGDPKPGDRITDPSYQGVIYTVDKVEQLDRDAKGIQRYKCTVMRE